NQCVAPLPLSTIPGFWRLEVILPRVYGGGSRLNGRLRYFAAAEFDYERIPVPEVTDQNGHDVLERSSTIFWRVDVQTTPHSNVSVESLLFPTMTRSKGLSPRREQEATADSNAHDRVVGLTDR